MTTSVIGIKPSNPLLGGHPNIPLNLPFIEGSGSVAGDLSDLSNDGDITDGVWTSTAHGWALTLNGTSAFVDCGNDSSLSPETGVAIEALIKSAPDGSYRYILSNGWTFNKYGSRLWQHTNQKAYFYAAYNENAAANTYTDSVLTGDITHIVATLEDSMLYMYVNGELQAKETAFANDISRGTANTYIGWGEGVRFLDGLVYYSRLHDVGLSAKDVKYLYLDLRRRLRI